MFTSRASSSVACTPLIPNACLLLPLTQKGRKLLKPTEWKNRRGSTAFQKINKSQNNPQVNWDKVWLETTKALLANVPGCGSDHQPQTCRLQVALTLQARCNFHTTIESPPPDSSSLYENSGKIQTSQWLKFNYSHSSPGVCWLGEMIQRVCVCVWGVWGVWACGGLS